MYLAMSAGSSLFISISYVVFLTEMQKEQIPENGFALLTLSLVGPSYVIVYYEKNCHEWSFFSLREHFSGAKTWL
jgi:hypothetical protein